MASRSWFLFCVLAKTAAPFDQWSALTDSVRGHDRGLLKASSEHQASIHNLQRIIKALILLGTLFELGSFREVEFRATARRSDELRPRIIAIKEPELRHSSPLLSLFQPGQKRMCRRSPSPQSFSEIVIVVVQRGASSQAMSFKVIGSNFSWIKSCERE